MIKKLLILPALLLVINSVSAGNVIESGQTENIAAGDTVEESKIMTGGIQNVEGTAANTMVDGGTQNFKTGSAIGGKLNYVKNNGIQNIEVGANIGDIDNYATIGLDGVQNVDGTSSFTIVQRGGTQNVTGTAISTTMIGGTQNVSGTLGGNTIIRAGATQNLNAGATIRDQEGDKITLSGGIQNINTAVDADMASRIQMSFGYQNIRAGGSISGMKLDSSVSGRYSVQNVFGTAVAENTTVGKYSMQIFTDATSKIAGTQNKVSTIGVIQFNDTTFDAAAGSILTMDGGLFRLGPDKHTLTTNANLLIQGNGIIGINLRSGNNGADSDFISFNNIQGDYGISLNYKKTEADALNQIGSIDIIENTSADTSLTKFSAIDSGIDIGLYHWDVETTDDGSKTTVTAKKTDRASSLVDNMLNNAYSIKSFVDKMANSMQKRVGELQWLDSYTHAPLYENAFWVRGIYKDSSLDSNINADVDATGVEFGYDRQLNAGANNNFFVGALAFMANGNAEYQTVNPVKDKTELSTYGLGLYGIWLNKYGWFFDAAARAQWVTQDVTAYNVGSLEQITFNSKHLAASLNLDFGREFSFGNDDIGLGWFLKPHVEWRMVYIDAADFTTSMGYDGTIEATNSMNASAELMFGPRWRFQDESRLQIYGRVGYVNEFSNDVKVKIGPFDLAESFSGGQVDFGLGLDYTEATGKSAVYIDAGYRTGSDLTEISGILGLRIYF